MQKNGFLRRLIPDVLLPKTEQEPDDDQRLNGD